MAPLNGSVNRGTFTVKKEPVDASRPMKVRVIGAGFSGILAAIRSVVCLGVLRLHLTQV